MKTYRNLSLLLALLVYSQSTAATYDALVVAVKGTAFEVDADELALRTLAPNARIAEGNGIRTSEGATLTIVLANGAVLTLEPDTLVYMDQLQLDGDASLAMNKPLKPSPADTQTRVRIDRGEILGEVKGLSPRSKFEIASPVGTAGISGTKFLVEVRSLGGNRYSMVITNLDGTVAGNAPGGEPASVEAGSKVVISATYDSVTGEVSTIETTSETIPSSTIQTLINGISENVEQIVEEVGANDVPQIILPIQLVEPEVIGDPQTVVIGTAT